MFSRKRPTNTLPDNPTPHKRKHTGTTPLIPIPQPTRPSFNALFQRPSFIEFFNKDKALRLKTGLEHIATTGSADPHVSDDLASLRAILDKGDGNDFIITEYHQSSNYLESGSVYNARFFASGPSGQWCSKRLRATIFGSDLYYDLGFVNCQPALLMQYAHDMGISVPNLQRIVSSREDVLEEIQAFDPTLNTREKAKEAIIKAMYGSQMIPSVPWWRDFIEEIAEITSEVCNSRSDLVAAAITAKDPHTFEPTVLSFFLGELECGCMYALYDFLVEQGLTQPGVGILMFDGIQIYRNPENDAVFSDAQEATALLQYAEDYIAGWTGYRLGIAVKGFAAGYDLPDGKVVEITQEPTVLEHMARPGPVETTTQLVSATKPSVLLPSVPIHPQYSDMRVIVQKRYDAFVGDIPIFQRTVALSAACGMGKTRVMVQFVSQLRNWVNVIVVHRKSVTNKLQYDLRNSGASVHVYSDITGVIRVKKGDVLLVQVESLKRLDYERFDWASVNLIMDEYSSLERQLAEGGGNPSVARAWKAVLHNAHRVVAMDAYLENHHILSLGMSRGCIDDILYLNYVYMKSSVENHHFYIKNGKKKGVDMVLQSLEDGERVVCACISRTLAEAIQRLVNEHQPSKRVLLVTALTPAAERKKATSDVNMVWAEYDLVLFTGTIEVGLSFEIEGHFDRTVAIIDSDVTTIDQVLQMIFRARCVKQYYVFVDRNIHTPLIQKGITTQLEEWDSRLERVLQGYENVLQGEIVDTEDFLGTTLRRTGFCISMTNVATHAYMSKKSFGPLLVQRLARYGGNIHVEECMQSTSSVDTAATKMTKEQLDAIKDEEAEGIATAPVITDTEYGVLKRKGHVDVDELRIMQKYELLRDYEIDVGRTEKELTAGMVRVLNNARQKRRFENYSVLKKALVRCGGDIGNALQYIEREGIARILNSVDSGSQDTSGNVSQVAATTMGMRDVVGFQLATAKLGHFRLCDDLLRYMFGDNGGMSLGTFEREFTQEEIATNLGCVAVVVTKSRRKKLEHSILDVEVLETFKKMTQRIKDCSYFSMMNSRYVGRDHGNGRVFVSDVIAFAAVVFGGVFGRPCEKTTSEDGRVTYKFIENKTVVLIASLSSV